MYTCEGGAKTHYDSVLLNTNPERKPSPGAQRYTRHCPKKKIINYLVKKKKYIFIFLSGEKKRRAGHPWKEKRQTSIDLKFDIVA